MATTTSNERSICVVRGGSFVLTTNGKIRAHGSPGQPRRYALHQMLAGVPETDRSAVWDQIEQALRQFETDDGLIGPCELLVASAAA